MTQSDPIYGLIALSFVFGIGLTVLIGAIWLYATEWLMEKYNVSDPLDKYYKNLFQQINQAHRNGGLGLIYVDKRKEYYVLFKSSMGLCNAKCQL